MMEDIVCEKACKIYTAQYSVKCKALCGNITENCAEVIRDVCPANYVDIISGNMRSEHLYADLSTSTPLSIDGCTIYKI